jgi:threonine/homoserine/homoserine lactone efflux protein
MELATLGAIFIAICALFYLLLGHAARRVLSARPDVARATTKVAGTAMIMVGVALLAERVVPLLGH